MLHASTCRTSLPLLNGLPDVSPQNFTESEAVLFQNMWLMSWSRWGDSRLAVRISRGATRGFLVLPTGDSWRVPNPFLVDPTYDE